MAKPTHGAPLDLFAGGQTRDGVSLTLRGADLAVVPGFLPPADADRLLQDLTNELPWRRYRVSVFGKQHLIPRLHSWHGDAQARYRWSGLTQEPRPWTPSLAEVGDRLAGILPGRFNSVLANLYRDGRDHMGWHADDEPELGPEPVIASISLGAQRDFLLRPRRPDAAAGKRCIALTHGSLLLMSGSTQRYWQHCLPKRLRVVEPRINLTFRRIVSAS